MRDLLEYPAVLKNIAQEAFLDELEVVVKEEENAELSKPPRRGEVWRVISTANQHMAPGTDGLTSYFYKHCFDMVSDVVTEMVKEIFDGGSPTYSQRLSRIVFGCKPKMPGSLNPKDK